MSPQTFNNLLLEIENSISEINNSFLVVDDSQMATRIENKSTDNNIMLIGVLPNYGNSGRNVDSYREVLTGQILVVEKTDYSDLSEDDFTAVFERTYLAAKKVIDILVEKAGNGCSPLSYLDVNSLEMFPVWKKAQCNGFSIEFQTY